jgi:hypothetical protein
MPRKRKQEGGGALRQIGRRPSFTPVNTSEAAIRDRFKTGSRDLDKA